MNDDKKEIFFTRKETLKVIIMMFTACAVYYGSSQIADLTQGIDKKTVLAPFFLLGFKILRAYGSGLVVYLGMTRIDRKLKPMELGNFFAGFTMLFLEPLAILAFSSLGTFHNTIMMMPPLP